MVQIVHNDEVKQPIYDGIEKLSQQEQICKLFTHDHQSNNSNLITGQIIRVTCLKKIIFINILHSDTITNNNKKRF